ncbi:hypothetical protein H8R18_00380 [Nanchangia anserum]|nr:hypothetical protein H8R18_00380 [Nanchangia anserum]
MMAPVTLTKQADGTYTATATPTTTATGDNAKVTFPNTPQLDDKARLTVTPGAPTATNSTLVITDASGSPLPNNTATAGQPITIVYTPRDEHGNLTSVPEGATVTVAVPKADGTTETVTLTKQPDGTYRGSATASKAGTNTVTAQVGGETGPSTSFTVTAGSPAKVTMPDGPLTGTVGTQVPSPGNAVVTDSAGNPVPEGTKVYVSVPGAEAPVEVTVGKDGKAPLPPFTPTAPGTQQIGVSANPDGSNPLGTKPITVVPAAPTLTSANATGVTGKAPDHVATGSTVTLLNGAGEKIGTGTTTSDGSFTITYTPGKEPANGEPVRATVTDSATNTTSAPSKPLTVDTTKAQTPTISAPDPKKPGEVSGTAHPGDTVTVCVNAKNCVDAAVDENGHYTVPVHPALTTGDVITVVAKDAQTGNTSDTAKTTVDFTAPDAPKVTVTENSDGSATVTVTPPASDVEGDPVATIDGKKVPLTKNDDGTYSYTVPVAQRTEKPLTVEATVADKAGNVSTPGKATIPQVTTPPPSDIAANATGVTGKVDESVPNGSKVTVTNADGDVIGTGTTSDGTFTVTYDKGKVPAHGDTVHVTVTNKDTGVESTPARGTVNLTKPGTPTVVADPKTPGVISGTADPGNTVTVCVGETCVTTTADAKGNYRVPVPGLKDGDTVTATAKDPATGNDSDPASVVVDYTAPGKPGLSVTRNEDGSYTAVITPNPDDKDSGKNTANLLIAKPGEPAGNSGLTGKVDPNTGAVTFTIPANQVVDGMTLTGTMTDPAGNTSVPSDPYVVDAKPPALSTDDYSSGDSLTGKTEPDASVEITYTDKDGTEHTVKVPVAEDGSFTAKLVPPAKDGTTITVVATDPAGNTTTVKTPVDARVPAKPTIVIDPAKPGTITGTSDPNTTITVCVDGTAGKRCTETTTDKDGNYTATINPAVTNGDTVTVVAKNPHNGKTSQSTTTADFTSNGLTDVTITDDGKTVTGTTDPNAPVTVTLPDGTVVTGTADADGDFTVTLPKPLTPGETITVTVTGVDGKTYTEKVTFGSNGSSSSSGTGSVTTTPPTANKPAAESRGSLARTGATAAGVAGAAAALLLAGWSIVAARRRKTHE